MQDITAAFAKALSLLLEASSTLRHLRLWIRYTQTFQEDTPRRILPSSLRRETPLGVCFVKTSFYRYAVFTGICGNVCHDYENSIRQVGKCVQFKDEHLSCLKTLTAPLFPIGIQLSFCYLTSIIFATLTILSFSCFRFNLASFPTKFRKYHVSSGPCNFLSQVETGTFDLHLHYTAFWGSSFYSMLKSSLLLNIEPLPGPLDPLKIETRKTLRVPCQSLFSNIKY